MEKQVKVPTLIRLHVVYLGLDKGWVNMMFNRYIDKICNKR